ncbi:MAG: response regulator [Bacilli bacterium]|nr:response regulator [Bacilli bacterium]
MIVTKLTCLTVFCIIFMISLIIIYFSKQRIKSEENRVYKIMLVVNLIGIFLQVASKYCAFYYDVLPPIFCQFMFKSFLAYFNVFAMLILNYVIILVIPKEKIKKVNTINYVFFGILSLITYFLPISVHCDLESQVAYTYGFAVTYSFIVAGLASLILLILLLPNLRKTSKKKVLPLFIFLLFCMVAIAIQKVMPDLMMMCFVESFLCFIMFHTIENPDIMMLNELYENRRIIESSNQDMSNFLFKISQEIRKPVKELIEISDGKNDNELKEINNISKHLDYLIDDALDLSGLSTKKLKLYNNKYNIRNLFDEIRIKAKNSINKDTKLDYKVSSSIPEYVYGDGVRLKQILGAVVNNAIAHTEKGYITIEINTIIKYDICRFIIDVTDSGKGMTLDKINEILNLKELDFEADLDDNTDNLKVVKVLTNKIGGSFMVQADDKGTTVSITIDQKIVENTETEISKKLDLYEESLHLNKKIMVVDENIKELTRITHFLEDKGNIVSSSLYANDVIEKIYKKYKYDLIILDDETSTSSAYDVLKELKKIEKFNTPVVIMIDDNKEFIKLHYLKDGFADVIMKSKLTSELERVIKKEL